MIEFTGNTLGTIEYNKEANRIKITPLNKCSTLFRLHAAKRKARLKRFPWQTHSVWDKNYTRFPRKLKKKLLKQDYEKTKTSYIETPSTKGD